MYFKYYRKESKKIIVHLNINLKESILLFAATKDLSPA
jgi:hypothetical protein